MSDETPSNDGKRLMPSQSTTIGFLGGAGVGPIIV